MLTKYRRVKDLNKAGFVREEKISHKLYKGTVYLDSSKKDFVNVIVKYQPRGCSQILRIAETTAENINGYRKLMDEYTKLEKTKEYRKILLGRFINDTLGVFTAVAAAGCAIGSLLTGKPATGMAEIVIAIEACYIRSHALNA